jgi:hypothetical protein
VRLIEVLERANSDKDSVAARTEEGDGRVEQFLDVERVDMLGWAVLMRLGEVNFQQPANVVSTRIVDREHEIRILGRSVQFRHPSGHHPRSYGRSAWAMPARTMIVR